MVPGNLIKKEFLRFPIKYLYVIALRYKNIVHLVFVLYTIQLYSARAGEVIFQTVLIKKNTFLNGTEWLVENMQILSETPMKIINADSLTKQPAAS